MAIVTRGILSAVGSVALAAGAPALDANGVQKRQYVKDLIRVGTWEIVETGDSLEVTAERMDHWIKTFNEMTAAGTKVPIPAGHNSDAEKNRGWVLGMFRDGDVLSMTAELIGEGIALASTNEVSIYVVPEYTDANGKVFKDAIMHVALTPTPVIPGQRPFVPVSLSKGKTTSVPVLRLSSGVANMDWKKLAAELGVTVAEGMTDEQVYQAVLAKIAEMKKSGADAAAQITTLSKEVGDLKAAVAASKQAPAEPAPQLVKLSRNSRTAEIDLLLKDNRITPKCAEGLKAACVDDNGVKLSLQDARVDKLLDDVLGALKHNEPEATGTRKPAGKTVELGRKTPGEKDDSRIDPELNDRIARMYGGKKK